MSNDRSDHVCPVHGGKRAAVTASNPVTTGIIRILPPVLHGVSDIAATTVLFIAPFVLGFTGDTVATVLYVVIDAGGLGATLLTRFESDLMPASPLPLARSPAPRPRSLGRRGDVPSARPIR